MSTIGKVSAVFTASTGGLVAGVNKAANSFGTLQSSADRLGGKLNALVAINAAQLFGSMASTAASWARSLVEVGRAEAEVIDRTSKLAARAGMTYGQFSSLALAGELAGVGMDTVAMAATKADVAFVKAMNGSAEARAKFEALGLSMDELAAMSPDQRFEAIAQAISQLPTEAEQAAAAVALFGRSGAALMPLFQGGANAISEAREQAERLGIALTTAQGRDVEAMNDAFTLAYTAVKGIVQQVVAYLSPALKAAADTFTNLVGEIGGANIGQAIGDALLQGARFLAGIGDYLIANFASVFKYLSDVGSQWNAVFDFMNRVAQFLYGSFKTFEAVGNSVAAAIMTAFSYVSSTAGELAAAYSSSADKNFAAAGEAFGNAFGSIAPAAGQAIAGPLTTSLDAAIAQAQQSATAVEEASARGADKIAEAVASTAPQAVKGVDSRSKEGIAEMFRIMRGGGQDVQTEQLNVLRDIRDEIAGEDDLLAVEF